MNATPNAASSPAHDSTGVNDSPSVPAQPRSTHTSSTGLRRRVWSASAPTTRDSTPVTASAAAPAEPQIAGASGAGMVFAAVRAKYTGRIAATTLVANTEFAQS